MEVNNFYKWWTETINGNYIPNEKFETVLERFSETKENNLTKQIL